MARNDPHTQLDAKQKKLLADLFYAEVEVTSVDDLPYRPAMKRIASEFNKANETAGRPKLGEGGVWRALKYLGKQGGLPKRRKS